MKAFGSNKGEIMNKDSKVLMGSTFLGFSIVMIIYIAYKLLT
jgi:hypothetical protein